MIPDWLLAVAAAYFLGVLWLAWALWRTRPRPERELVSLSPQERDLRDLGEMVDEIWKAKR
jgi:uncharacterized protein YjiS (DUF1127 family)